MCIPPPGNPAREPVLVAIEGLCLTGKSTLARALRDQLGAIVVPEYADLAPLPPWPPHTRADAITALRHFLALERHRTALAHRTQATLIVLDRSPVSLIAHEFGMARLGVPTAPTHAARMFSDAADHGRILTPDAYIHLRVPRLVASTREARRGRLPAHLTHPSVQAGIEEATHAYLDALPAGRRLELDGTDAPTNLVQAVVRLVTELASAGDPAPAWRILAPLDPNDVIV